MGGSRSVSPDRDRDSGENRRRGNGGGSGRDRHTSRRSDRSDDDGNNVQDMNEGHRALNTSDDVNMVDEGRRGSNRNSSNINENERNNDRSSNGQLSRGNGTKSGVAGGEIKADPQDEVVSKACPVGFRYEMRRGVNSSGVPIYEFTTQLTREKASFVLGKHGKTMFKIGTVAAGGVPDFEGKFVIPRIIERHPETGEKIITDPTVHLELSQDNRFNLTGRSAFLPALYKTLKYLRCLLQQREGVSIKMSESMATWTPMPGFAPGISAADDDEDVMESDLTLMDIPSSAVGFVTGKNGNFLRQIEDEWPCLMFFADYEADSKDKKKEEDKDGNEINNDYASKAYGDREFEKLAIFGGKKARRGAELKVASAVEAKISWGFFKRFEDEIIDRDFVKKIDWSTELLRFKEDELSFALGKRGATRRKLEQASNLPVVQYISDIALFTGSHSERDRIKEYTRFLFSQLEGPVTVENWEKRPDCTVICVPTSVVGYVTGSNRQTLSAVETEFGVMMFFMGVRKPQTNGETGDPEQDLEKLIIFGPQRARIGAKLKILWSVEVKCVGYYSRNFIENRDEWSMDDDVRMDRDLRGLSASSLMGSVHTTGIDPEVAKAYKKPSEIILMKNATIDNKATKTLCDITLSKDRKYSIDENGLEVASYDDRGNRSSYVAIDIMKIESDFVGYLLGKSGITRKKLGIAANAHLQYIGSYAVIAGTQYERSNCRDYISWLLKQREGGSGPAANLQTASSNLDSIKMSKDLQDDIDISIRGGEFGDLTAVPLPSSCVSWVAGLGGQELRQIEDRTKTFCFLSACKPGDYPADDTDGDIKEQLLICGAERGYPGGMEGRIGAKRMVEDLIMQKKRIDQNKGKGKGMSNPWDSGSSWDNSSSYNSSYEAPYSSGGKYGGGYNEGGKGDNSYKGSYKGGYGGKKGGGKKGKDKDNSYNSYDSGYNNSYDNNNSSYGNSGYNNNSGNSYGNGPNYFSNDNNNNNSSNNHGYNDNNQNTGYNKNNNDNNIRRSRSRDGGNNRRGNNITPRNDDRNGGGNRRDDNRDRRGGGGDDRRGGGDRDRNDGGRDRRGGGGSNDDNNNRDRNRGNGGGDRDRRDDRERDRRNNDDRDNNKRDDRERERRRSRSGGRGGGNRR